MKDPRVPGTRTAGAACAIISTMVHINHNACAFLLMTGLMYRPLGAARSRAFSQRLIESPMRVRPCELSLPCDEIFNISRRKIETPRSAPAARSASVRPCCRASRPPLPRAAPCSSTPPPPAAAPCGTRQGCGVRLPRDKRHTALSPQLLHSLQQRLRQRPQLTATRCPSAKATRAHEDALSRRPDASTRSCHMRSPSTDDTQRIIADRSRLSCGSAQGAPSRRARARAGDTVILLAVKVRFN